MTKETLSIKMPRMDRIKASKHAIDRLGAVELADRLSRLTNESVTVYAVRKWRQRGIPGEWVPAVSAITGMQESLLNPLVPEGFPARECAE